MFTKKSKYAGSEHFSPHQIVWVLVCKMFFTCGLSSVSFMDAYHCNRSPSHHLHFHIVLFHPSSKMAITVPPQWQRLLITPQWQRLLITPQWLRLLITPQWQRLLITPQWQRLLITPQWLRLLITPQWLRLLITPQWLRLLITPQWQRLLITPQHQLRTGTARTCNVLIKQKCL